MLECFKLSGLFSLLLLSFCSLGPGVIADFPYSPRSVARLERLGEIENPLIVESSGLVKSRHWPDLFWTHNDSGHHARIFPIRGDGSRIEALVSGSGIQVLGAENVDWEDITTDDKGHLVIGDIGNNVSHRPTLAIYLVKEPNPFEARETAPAEKISVYFPESPSRAFNSEALFWAKGYIYLLTKNRGGTNTGLYRIDAIRPGEMLPLIRIGSFDFGAPVTAADTSPDGRLLAVLTYKAVWLFEHPMNSHNYLEGKYTSVPFRIWQCEAVCFDGEKLLIGNEGRTLFGLDLSVLLPIE